MLGTLLALALGPQDPSAASLRFRTWSVDGAPRTALLHVPTTAKTTPAPLVFVFHGHGGRSASIARTLPLHELWPEAVVVYPQGLPTATGRDPDGARPGWQNRAGLEGDRDLHFLDAMLTSLRAELRIDPNHVHATGHSNGGGFTYLLLAERSETFASFAPISAGAAGAAAAAARGATPALRPVLHIAGREDRVVPFAQQQRTIDALIARAGAGPGEPWDLVPGVTLHHAANGAHVATLIHDGGHPIPVEAPAAIAGFLQHTGLPNPWVPEPVRGPGLVHHVYASPAAGTEVGYHVYLPPGYGDDPAARYPVLYWLHGSGGGQSGIAPVAALFDDAIGRGLLPPLLVVFPVGLANGMWCDAVGGPPVETVVLGELLPRIDRLFRTRPAPAGRLVAGFSMGGYGALRFGLAFPDRFAAAISLAGGPLQQDFTAAPRVDEARRRQVLREVYGDDLAVFRARSPWALAEAKRGELQRGPRLLLAVGSADETLPANRALHEHLRDLGIAHEYVELDGIGHEPLRVFAGLGPRLWQFVRSALGG